MAEWVLTYADTRGKVQTQVAEAPNEAEARARLQQQGFLVYSVKPKGGLAGLAFGAPKAKPVNLEKFLIFNQQFVTLVKAGLPILKCLDLLADRLTDAKLGPHIQAVREEVRNGTVLSEAFARQGVFPPIYVTSLLAGERSGALVEVLDRYLTYQRLALSIRKKILLSLVYPSLLFVLTIGLIVYLITGVVPKFAELYGGLQAKLPGPTVALIAIGEAANEYLWPIAITFVLTAFALRLWVKSESGQETIEKIILKTPLAGEAWIKYQVAQLSRVLGTLLIGGIPLIQALETAGESVGTRLLRASLVGVRQSVREGRPLSRSLAETGIMPDLAVDMVEVGESTGALPSMLSSVAEFYEDDVQTRVTAALSLIEPVIMIFMGTFVAFVLIALYLPIFSLSGQI